MNYNELRSQVESFRNKYKGKLVANNTRLLMNYDLSISVKLHNTDIVVFDSNGDIILNTGGYYTVTTKTRMNEFLPEGYKVFQKKGTWYLETPDKTLEYKDKMNIYASRLVRLLA